VSQYLHVEDAIDDWRFLLHEKVHGYVMDRNAPGGLAVERTAMSMAMQDQVGSMTIDDLSTYTLDSLAAAGAVCDPTPTLRRQRGGWEIRYRDEAASVSDSKGFRDLAVLLRRPGVDVHVLELAGSPVDAGASIEMVDRTALAQYRQRLADLDDDRAEAERNHDTERVARIMGKQPGNVRVLSHRGLRNLARRLAAATADSGAPSGLPEAVSF